MYMQTCTQCILDQHDDPAITFDSNGVCNYCQGFKKEFIDNMPSPAEKETRLKQALGKIKSERKGKKYDSILGVSGGVDSSYLAFLAKEFGLNPLLVHFDNGWNSELAVDNINKIVDHTGFDLYTYVVDWEEFRDLQLAYIRASVIDWEVPTDHGLMATLYNQAARHRIKYVLTGFNYQTEAILPKPMRWSKRDVANIVDIHKKFGTKRLKTMPLLGFYRLNYLQFLRGFESVKILELIDYNKEEAKAVIAQQMGWRDYGGKHYESIFTRFYQGYVLKEKFGVDKRKAHLSSLICSGQMTREEAMAELEKPAYDPDLLREDKAYVIKKLGLTPGEFDQIIQQPPVGHLAFRSYETGLYPKHQRFMQTIKPVTGLVKRLVM